MTINVSQIGFIAALFLAFEGNLSRAAEPKPGDVIENTFKMKLAYIPPGGFDLGASSGPLGGAPEGWHPVVLSKGFFMGIHEVTVGQFREFARQAKYKTEAEADGKGSTGWNETTMEFIGRDPKFNWSNTGFPQDDKHPVVNVSWNDVQAFCDWLSTKEGKTYRLPTDAEWEYACRVGTTSDFYFGDDMEKLVQFGNVADAAAKAKFTKLDDWKYLTGNDGHAFTAPVGSFKPNAFGLFDMHGNVREWCQDWFDTQARAEGETDPRGPAIPPAGGRLGRVNRGGSWWYDPARTRSVLRTGIGAKYRGVDMGFRVVLNKAP